MTTQTEALKLALEAQQAWERSDVTAYYKLKALEPILKEALAQPEQEPVAWRWKMSDVHPHIWEVSTKPHKMALRAEPLYTTPPQRTWVGLNDDDKKQIAKAANYNWEMTTGEYAERIGRLTEEKLKELNT